MGKKTQTHELKNPDKKERKRNTSTLELNQIKSKFRKKSINQKNLTFDSIERSSNRWDQAQYTGGDIGGIDK